MLYPKPLSYFLSFNVLRELRNIDKDIFKKIISHQADGNLFNKFNFDDYYNFYNEFYEELLEIKNMEFIHGLSELYCNSQLKHKHKLINFILDKYESKIDEFKPRELLLFMGSIEDIETYKKFVNKNHEKLSIVFDNSDEYNLFLKEHLKSISGEKQKFLVFSFIESIITKIDIKKIINEISLDIIIDLYNKNKETFSSLTLYDWIELFSMNMVFNKDTKAILDNIKIDSIEELCNNIFSNVGFIYFNIDTSSLKYTEEKYRSSIKTDGKLEEIDNTTSIFSGKYFKNLSELKEMFKNNLITRKDQNYKEHLALFIVFLKNRNIIDSFEGNNLKEIEKLFYRIVMGKSVTELCKITSIQGIAMLNRLNKIEFDSSEFSVEQIENYNVRQHKQLYGKIDETHHMYEYKRLVLKLIFMIGFNNAKALLEIDNSLPTLEHLVGNVYVKNIVIDEHGNPVLNNKLMNLLFSDKDNSKIKEMLSNKNNELYKYFPRIFNDWEVIKVNGKDKSLKTVIEFLNGSDITLSPKYYRLNESFKVIGCKSSIVNETLELHDKMLSRTSSTIPRITGQEKEYSYEILGLDDMEGLCVGNRTACCFTVLGTSYSSLKHSLTSKNGRILVIRRNGEILAHSWLWRNGDLLCLDNIEISKSINCVDFFDVYERIADEIIKTSYEHEGIDNCIKNITIGINSFDEVINGIEKYPCLVSKTCDLENNNFKNKIGDNRRIVNNLPQPIEKVSYSDSKNVQYLIRGNGVFNLGQSYFNYLDERKEIMHYLKDNSYDEDYIKTICEKINELRYLNAELNNGMASYKVIDIGCLKEVYCNNDWYIIVYLDGSVEKFNRLLDKRAFSEMSSVSLSSDNVLRKKRKYK